MRLTKLELVASLAVAQAGILATLATVRGQGGWPDVTQAVAKRDGTVAAALALLLVFATCVALAHRRDAWGSLGLVGACTLGTVFAVVIAGEPATWQILDPRTFGLPGALLAAIALLFMALVPVLGIQELLEQRLASLDW